MEGRICAAGVATSLGGFGLWLSYGVLLSLGLLEVWPTARACSRERRLSAYVRAGAREELCRGLEKIRKVVRPSASPRVGANLEAIVEDSVVYLRQYGTMCRCNAQAVMMNSAVRYARAAVTCNRPKRQFVVFLALVQAQTPKRHVRLVFTLYSRMVFI